MRSRQLRLPDGLLDLSTGEVRREGQASSRLSGQELEVLEVLLAHDGDPVSREALLREVWDWSAGHTRAVDHCLKRLRRKLEIDSRRPSVLLTVRGKGYRLVAPLEPVPKLDLVAGRIQLDAGAIDLHATDFALLVVLANADCSPVSRASLVGVDLGRRELQERVERLTGWLGPGILVGSDEGLLLSVAHPVLGRFELLRRIGAREGEIRLQGPPGAGKRTLLGHLPERGAEVVEQGLVDDGVCVVGLDRGAAAALWRRHAALVSPRPPPPPTDLWDLTAGLPGGVIAAMQDAVSPGTAYTGWRQEVRHWLATLDADLLQALMTATAVGAPIDRDALLSLQVTPQHLDTLRAVGLLQRRAGCIEVPRLYAELVSVSDAFRRDVLDRLVAGFLGAAPTESGFLQAAQHALWQRQASLLFRVALHAAEQPPAGWESLVVSVADLEGVGLDRTVVAALVGRLDEVADPSPRLLVATDRLRQALGLPTSDPTRPETDDPLDLALWSAHCGNRLLAAGEHTEAIPMLESAAALGHAHDQGYFAARVRTLLGAALRQAGQVEPAIAVYYQALDTLALGEPSIKEAVIRLNLAVAQRSLGRYTPAIAELRSCLDWATANRVEGLCSAAHQNLALLLLERGELEEACTEAECACDAGARSHQVVLESVALATLALARLHRGDLAGARRAAARGAHQCEVAGNRRIGNLLSSTLAQLDLMSGNRSAGLERLERAREDAVSRADSEALGINRVMGAMALYPGDEARDLARSAVSALSGRGSPWMLAVALGIAGETVRAQGLFDTLGVRQDAPARRYLG